MTKNIHVYEKALRKIRIGYYLWFICYMILGSSSFLLSFLAAVDVTGGSWNRIFSGATSLCVFFLGVLQPHRYATGFDAAISILDPKLKARMDDIIDDKELNSAYEAAMKSTSFQYTLPDHLNPHD